MSGATFGRGWVPVAHTDEMHPAGPVAAELKERPFAVA
jgi:phenylpropionate dioxygenase-like ring-hydroxylating dioxygenase large terminal subunit